MKINIVITKDNEVDGKYVEAEFDGTTKCLEDIVYLVRDVIDPEYFNKKLTELTSN